MEVTEEGKKCAIISYLTFVGPMIAWTMNFEKDDEFANFHIRQSFGLVILFILIAILISSFDSVMIFSSFWLFFIILWGYGFGGAIKGEKRIVPIVGKLFQKTFSKKK